mmetsp:Transcript_139926/g.243641  ORF Transcript_139926/g.243641 Transcript_139926/m.243641 type:complete len:205 (+) Transcript_139926:199-813(+)
MCCVDRNSTSGVWGLSKGMSRSSHVTLGCFILATLLLYCPSQKDVRNWSTGFLVARLGTHGVAALELLRLMMTKVKVTGTADGCRNSERYGRWTFIRKVAHTARRSESGLLYAQWENCCRSQPTIWRERTRPRHSVASSSTPHCEGWIWPISRPSAPSTNPRGAVAERVSPGPVTGISSWFQPLQSLSCVSIHCSTTSVSRVTR